ncbi:hypothetical protein ACN28S_04240 [Cystobacter fuscus]
MPSLLASHGLRALEETDSVEQLAHAGGEHHMLGIVIGKRTAYSTSTPPQYSY